MTVNYLALMGMYETMCLIQHNHYSSNYYYIKKEQLFFDNKVVWNMPWRRSHVLGRKR